MEGEGQNKFDRDSKFSGGSCRNTNMFYYIILFYFNPQKSVGGMEERDRKI